MATDVVMPKLGLTMSHGTIARWHKRVGDAVRVGEPLLDVSTDKINYEVESIAAGIVRDIVAAEGDECACGATLCVIAVENEAAPAPAPSSPPANGRTVASPAARKLARERNVQLHDVVGTGPRGRVTMSDVASAPANANLAATPGPNPAVASASAALPSQLDPKRRTIFRRMNAAASIPQAQVETSTSVDALHDLIERRRDFGWTAALVYAVARSLAHDPSMRIDATTGALFESIDIGLAADTPHGLIVPVVRRADRCTLSELQREILRLASAAREGSIGHGDIGGACFSISNVGPQGVLRVRPIVDAPQTAILGAGAVTQRPIVHGGSLAIGWVLDLTLSFDHRFIDGAPAARFLAQVARGLSEPGLLL